MPSIEESKRKVKEGLNATPNIDHDAVLAGLEDEIDRHNARNSMEARVRHERANKGEKSGRFRFKSGVKEPGKRKRGLEHDRDRRKQEKSMRRDKNPPRDEDAVAHPFPREPVDTDRFQSDPTSAFRESLFDALADDEGAAYWESVYSQPIHIYQRPTVETPQGELERMSDEDYAAYVQTKMWEKKNPHIVLERKQKETRKREEEEDRARRREEFIHRKQRAAWERAQEAGAHKFGSGEEDEGYADYEYVFNDKGRSQRFAGTETGCQYNRAWEQYLSSWDRLKRELIEDTAGHSGNSTLKDPSKRIPWPVLEGQRPVRTHIEAFMRNAPAEGAQTKLRLFKQERVKWHPDKIQQRFAGAVNEGSMKIVTGVFHVVDELLEEERKKEQR